MVLWFRFLRVLVLLRRAFGAPRKTAQRQKTETEPELVRRARLLGDLPSWVVVPTLNVRGEELRKAVLQLGRAAVALRKALGFPWRYIAPARRVSAETDFRIELARVQSAPLARRALDILEPGMVEAGIFRLLGKCPGERVSELFKGRL